MVLPNVPRAANPTINPDRPAEASRLVEMIFSSSNCERPMAKAVIHTPMLRRRRVSASCVAVSGFSVPRFRSRSITLLNPMLMARVSIQATASRTSTVIT